MKKRLLALFDPEEPYMFNLIEYLNKMDTIFEIKGFTDRNEFLQFCSLTCIDILLIADTEAGYATSVLNVKQIIILKSGREIGVWPYPLIYKYQSADNIIKEVLECCPDEEETKYPAYIKRKNINIIGVYSPINRCKKTSFAITMANIYSKSIPTLYINTEEFSGLSNLLSKDFRDDLSDLFYFLKSSPQKFPAKVFSTIQSLYDIDFIPPMRYAADLKNIEANEWKEFLGNLIDCTDYRVIIFDWGNTVKDIFSLIELCDLLYMPFKSDIISKSKLLEFENYMKSIKEEEFLDRIFKLDIPSEYSMQYTDNYFEHLLLSPFTNYVKEIIKENTGRN